LKQAYDAAGEALNVQRRHKLAQIFIAMPAAAKDQAAKEVEVAEGSAGGDCEVFQAAPACRCREG
jgi:hypothetical protein